MFNIPVFSPVSGLKILTKMIEEKVGHPVSKYEMRFFGDENRIDFLVFMSAEHFDTLKPPNVLYSKYNNENHCHLYAFEQSGAEKICSIVKKLIKLKIKDDSKLDYAIVVYDTSCPDKAIINAYITINNVKQKQIIEL